MDGARVDAAGGTSSARLRRERRLRSMLRHERMAVAMALAEALHHSSGLKVMERAQHAALRGQKTGTRAGVAGPAPVTEYVAPAPAVAPFSAPAVTYGAPAPVVEFVAPAPAVTYAAPAPVVGYVAPAPAVSYAAPAPVVDYVAPAPALTYASLAPVIVYVAPAPAVTHAAPAPVVGCVAPAPAVSYAAPAPVVDYVAPAPAVTYASLAPVIVYVAPAPAVTHATPAPVFEYVTPAPVFGFIAPAPAGSVVAPSQQLRPAYSAASAVTGVNLDADVVGSASQVVGSLPHGEVFAAPVFHQVHHVSRGEIPENLMEILVARRPPPLVDVRPSSRAQRHFMEDLGELAPSGQLLDLPVPQMVENVTDTLLRILDFPIAEQVIDVPKIFCSRVLCALGFLSRSLRISWWKCRPS